MNRLIYKLLFFVALMASLPALASADMSKGHSAPAGQSQGRVYGKVVTSMDVNNYTYVQIDTGSKKYWAAGPKTVLKKGAMIAIETNLPFQDFESKALKKKFKTIYFVNNFISDQADQAGGTSDPHAGVKMPAMKSGQAGGMSDPHAGVKMSGKAVTLKGIKKLKDGKSVADVRKHKKELAGKSVRVRGKVVKYTAKVMGKNWLHIQDSSGPDSLVVTTDQEVKKGDLVVVNGIVAVDQDLGYGYTYDVIVERAIVSVE